MATKTYYPDLSYYLERLPLVMKRFGPDLQEYTYKINRKSSWIQLKYRGRYYRLEQTVANASLHGVELRDGAATFAQLVLALEDIIRLVKRGVCPLPGLMKPAPKASKRSAPHGKKSR